MVEVMLRAVRVDVESATPLLLLEEVHGSRVLPIFIGAPEAAAIAYALHDVPTTRPMTHDLLNQTIAALGGRLFNVEITNLVGSTYHAALRITTTAGEIVVSDAPPNFLASTCHRTFTDGGLRWRCLRRSQVLEPNHALERDNDDGSGHSLFVGEYDSVVGTRQRVGGNRVRVDNGPIQGNGPLHQDRRLGAHVYRFRC